MFKILLLLLFLFSSALAVDLESFVKELKSNQDKVIEFKYLREQAKLLGIKHVYLFGGTAASWGNYIRNYLNKKETDRSFDFDYMSIYRANQDFDIAIDASIEQAQKLESAMQEKFNYFSGTRPSWEVRLLNEQRADKEAILGFDFQNQHTDSHSTGLIDVMDCDDCIKDARDMSNPRSAFLIDIYEAKLHYYFSPKHHLTSRFKARKNPPILSVVRYFTKANQGKLLMRESDIAILQKMINEFNPSDAASWDPYVLRWLEKNAKKLIVNAIDMEFAWNLIDQMGLRSKLIALSNPKTENSMGWWLSKEPLRSKDLGITGRTARELFGKDQIMVAHETNSFEAYESITKSHDLMANALISRKKTAGERAFNGDGFYVMLGREGGGFTGFTIRFYLHPDAREGIDFTFDDGIIVIKNKNALRVIQESLVMSPVEYFEKLAAGIKFDITDKGVTERLKRSISHKMNILSSKEKAKIKNIIIKNFKSDKPNSNFIQKSLDIANLYKDPVLSELLSDFIKNYIAKRGDMQWFAEHFLSKSEILNHPNIDQFINFYIAKGEEMGFLAYHVILKPEILKHPNIANWINDYIAKGEDMEILAKHVLSKPEILNHPNIAQFINAYIAKGEGLKVLVEYVLLKPEILNHPNIAQFINAYIAKGKDIGTLAEHVLSKPEILNHPNIAQFINAYIAKGKDIRVLAEHVLSKPKILNHPNIAQFINAYIEKGESIWYLPQFVLSKPEILSHPNITQWINNFIAKGEGMGDFAEHVLSKPEILNHPNIAQFINAYIAKGKDIRVLAEHVLSKPKILNHPNIAQFITNYIEKGESLDSLEYRVLSNSKAKIALGFKADTEPSQIIAVIQEKIKTNKNKASSNCNPLFIKSSYSTF